MKVYTLLALGACIHQEIAFARILEECTNYLDLNSLDTYRVLCAGADCSTARRFNDCRCVSGTCSDGICEARDIKYDFYNACLERVERGTTYEEPLELEWLWWLLGSFVIVTAIIITIVCCHSKKIRQRKQREAA